MTEEPDRVMSGSSFFIYAVLKVINDFKHIDWSEASGAEINNQNLNSIYLKSPSFTILLAIGKK